MRGCESTLDNIAAAIPVSGGYSVHVKPEDLASLIAEVREWRAMDAEMIAASRAHCVEMVKLTGRGYPPANEDTDVDDDPSKPPALSAADVEALRSVHDEIDRVIAAHDPSDPRHRSHGGQHTNGRCCVLGNVNPGAIRGLREWRTALDSLLTRLTSAGGGR